MNHSENVWNTAILHSQHANSSYDIYAAIGYIHSIQLKLYTARKSHLIWLNERYKCTIKTVAVSKQHLSVLCNSLRNAIVCCRAIPSQRYFHCVCASFSSSFSSLKSPLHHCQQLECLELLQSYLIL